MKTFTDQEINAAVTQAPKVIQEEISGGFETAEFLADLCKRFGLHIDTMGKVGELNRNMLLGLISPQEFLQELISVGVKKEDAEQIMKEINEKIFVPLHEKMRAQATKEGVPDAPAPEPKAVAPAPTASAPPLGTINHGPLPTMSTPLAEKTLNRLATPPAPGAPAPRPAPPAPRPAVVTSGLSAALKSAGVQLLEDHEEPHIEFKKPAAPAPAPIPTPSAPTSLPKPMATSTFAAPPPPQTPRPPVPTPVPSASIPMPKPPQPTMPASTTYTVDPYREAPEAHEK